MTTLVDGFNNYNPISLLVAAGRTANQAAETAHYALIDAVAQTKETARQSMTALNNTFNSAVTTTLSSANMASQRFNEYVDANVLSGVNKACNTIEKTYIGGRVVRLSACVFNNVLDVADHLIRDPFAPVSEEPVSVEPVSAPIAAPVSRKPLILMTLASLITTIASSILFGAIYAGKAAAITAAIGATSAFVVAGTVAASAAAITGYGVYKLIKA